MSFRTVTVQGATIAAVSNILAQGITVYQKRSLSSLDPAAFLQFVVLAIISTPPNYKWQLFLERKFPSTYKKDVSRSQEKKDGDTKEQLSVRNTIAKFVLDQTVGAILNTIFFIAMINLLRGAGWSRALTAVEKDFWPMFITGFKFWPLVSLANLIFVPVEQRMLVGGLAGLVWGIYVSLLEL
ncbi:hypothetical protein HRR83_004417 [Exophiala dermatitidis]|uniref:Protein Mpv17 n=1 Tax=Exophiala dermatitidis TaxID=5970 RepID=A0AAN6IXN3_EXODE|nr:hypothetical protein HRR73_006120 [Exophiala dermatitidis]KAJ4517627.1 hypothetical protein HRR75_002845 [Exophiala dermatitidis]KAJ4521278.1 hypothetical protein HRR74_003101 [Exophiala dermatitidis]KAJ4544706.1 hypothetical protein HRR76_002754 [Exophiala dermatitidis]KAJ4551899.1 hypothetical protein HRR78_003465 [Exophiala dermatitidis]